MIGSPSAREIASRQARIRAASAVGASARVRIATPAKQSVASATTSTPSTTIRDFRLLFEARLFSCLCHISRSHLVRVMM